MNQTAVGTRPEGARIVVVEDDGNTGTLLAYNLEAAGYRVDVIASGAAALDAIAAAKADLIVLDWELPGLSGIEVMRQLRQRADAHRVPVVMLTGRTDREDRCRAQACGVDAFIAKPFSLPQLMSEIARLLALRGSGDGAGAEAGLPAKQAGKP